MKQLVQLATLSAVNIALAFLFQWYALTALGAGFETDALFAGMTVPQLVLAVISGSLMHVLVPLLSGESDSQRRQDAWAFVVLVGGLFTVLAVVLYVLAPWWVPLTVPGFDAASRTLTVELTRIQLIGMVFTAVNGVQWAAYHARQQFVWAEFAPIIASALALLVLIWALPRFGVVAAAIISASRMGLQTILLAPGMGRPVRPDLRSATIRNAWSRIKPLLLGSAYYKTDSLVDRFLLSAASSGSLSLYYLAQQMYSAVNHVLTTAISAPLVPRLTKLHASGDVAGFRRLYRAKLLQVGTITLATLLALGFAGRLVLDLLIGHGSVTSTNVNFLWLIMLCLGGAFAGGAMGQISSSSFYAMGDTATPTRIGIYTFTLYVPVKVVFYHVFGIWGLALSTSVFFLVNLLLQNHYMKKHFITFHAERK